jgi:hypothetical protein
MRMTAQIEFNNLEDMGFQKFLKLFLLTGFIYSTSYSIASATDSLTDIDPIKEGRNEISHLVASSDCKWVKSPGETADGEYYLMSMNTCHETLPDGSKSAIVTDFCTGNVYCKHRIIGAEFWVDNVMCPKTDDNKCRFPLNCINDTSYVITLKRVTADGKTHLVQPLVPDRKATR